MEQYLWVAEVALDVVVLRSVELSAARAFYEAVGLTFVAEKHGSGPDHLAATLAGGVVLELYPAVNGDRPANGSVADLRLGFVVADVVATIRAVQDAGGNVHSEPQIRDGRRRAVAVDPDGRRVGLTSPA